MLKVGICQRRSGPQCPINRVLLASPCLSKYTWGSKWYLGQGTPRKILWSDLVWNSTLLKIEATNPEVFLKIGVSLPKFLFQRRSAANPYSSMSCVLSIVILSSAGHTQLGRQFGGNLHGDAIAKNEDHNYQMKYPVDILYIYIYIYIYIYRPPNGMVPQEPPPTAATYYVRLPTTCYSPYYLLLRTTTYYQLLTTAYPTPPHPTKGRGIGRCYYY